MCVIKLLVGLILSLGAVTAATVKPPYEELPSPLPIVNGNEIYIYEHPYVVYLAVAATNELICGGTIVNRWAVLTAAHCIATRTMAETLIVAGFNKENRNVQYREIYRISIHPQYVDNMNDPNHRYMDYDYAILHLGKPFKYSMAVRWVTLAQSMDHLKVGEPMYAIGLGATHIQPLPRMGYLSRRLPSDMTPEIMRKVWDTPKFNGIILYLDDITSCRRNYTNINIGIPDRFFCASTTKGGICRGDSGSPIVISNVQYGIASYSQGCASRGYATAFASVPQVYNWIIETSRGSRVIDVFRPLLIISIIFILFLHQ